MLPTYNLRQDGYSRAIAGESSGGICAFNAAWFMPDKFARVHSAVGSFTSIQWRSKENVDGGNVYPFMVRKDPKRNIRVWMSDGSDDLETTMDRGRCKPSRWSAFLALRQYQAFESGLSYTSCKALQGALDDGGMTL